MPLVMPDEQFPARPVIVMIVGTPFSFKTSLAMTSKDPIVIDGDRGGDRAVGRVPIFVLSQGWAEVEEEEKNGLFNGRSTCILDTPKAIIDDYMWDRSQQLQYTANTQKIYGYVGTMFKTFVAKRRMEGMDIVVVSHEKSKDQNDTQVYEPDITGQSKQLLLRMCDQVGFMWKQEVKGADGKMIVRTVLTFNPKPQWPFCKNVAALPDLILPHYSSVEWKNFMDREIIEPTKKAISSMTDEQRAALQIIEEWQTAIDAIVPDGRDVATELTKLMAYISDKVAEEHLKKQIKAYFSGHLLKIGWKYDGKSKKFIVNQDNAKAEDKPADNPQPVETKKELTPLEARIDQLVEIGLSWNEADRSFGILDFKYISLESVESYDAQKWEETIKGISEHVAENTLAPVVEAVKSLIPPATGPQISQPDMFAPVKK